MSEETGRGFGRRHPIALTSDNCRVGGILSAKGEVGFTGKWEALKPACYLEAGPLIHFSINFAPFSANVSTSSSFLALTNPASDWRHETKCVALRTCFLYVHMLLERILCL